MLIFLILSAVAVYRNLNDIELVQDDPAFRRRILSFGKIPRKEIFLNPLTELDLLPRDQVFRLRTEYVMKNRELIDKDYTPSAAVFGQVESGLTWWGIYGIAGFGNGKKSIEGPSEETRFINNPFLLAGLCENYAVPLEKFDPSAPEEIFPRPLKLVWDSVKREAEVLYDYSGYLDQCYRYDIPEYVYKTMSLYCLNARDFGFHHALIDTGRSGNADLKQGKGEIVRVPFYLHKGFSSGYPGGSNNGSPAAPNFDVVIHQVPVDLTIRFWYEKPKSRESGQDFKYIMKLR